MFCLRDGDGCACRFLFPRLFLLLTHTIISSEASARRSPATEMPMMIASFFMVPPPAGGLSGGGVAAGLRLPAPAGRPGAPGMITVTAIGGGSICVGEDGVPGAGGG